MTMQRVRVCVAAAALALLGSFGSTAHADTLAGTYDTRTADGSKTTPAGNTVGPWTLTSTDATASWLRFTLTGGNNPTFAQLTELSVNFFSPLLNAQVNSDGPISQATANAGGGGGAPRLTLALDSNGDLTADQFLDIHLGTSPSYVDSPTSLNLYSGMNLVGNNDAGRYDLSGSGGSPFTNYTAALGLVGSSKLLRMTVFVDSFGGADKTLQITSMTAAVPLPPAAWAGLALLGLVAGAKLVRNRSEASLA